MSTPDMGIFANIIAAMANGPDADKVIVTFVDEKTDTVQTRTYKELYRNANVIAAYMIDRGMEKGDCFGALLQNHPEIIEAIIAASIAGAVIVPIDPRTKGDKLAFIYNNSNCRGTLCGDYNAAQLAEVAPNTGLEWTVLVTAENAVGSEGLPNAVTAREVLSQQRETLEVRATSPLDAIQILYTSGTTGDPKGIVKSNLSTAFGAMATQLFGITKDDVLYTGLSLTHGNAQGFTMTASLSTGVPSVYSQKFTKSGLWSTVRRFNCTIFNLLGGMTAAVYSDPRKDNDSDNPVRMVISAGMPEAIWKDFEKRYDLKLFEVYGAAEGGLFWNDGSGPVGAMGHLTSNPLYEARVVDKKGDDVAAGETGELIWRNRDDSPVLVEYLDKPGASRKKTAGGWFRTGDIVHADEDGWLYFDYRDGGGIRRNGDFINPGFVEKVLAEIESVNDVFIYGVPSSNGTPGEKDVVAAIVPSRAVVFDAQAVLAVCVEKLERNFVPSYFQLVDEIPKTASEKPQERFLLDAFSPDADNVVVTENS
jgi:crotonobetaine/carnitine-CoA ligase